MLWNGNRTFVPRGLPRCFRLLSVIISNSKSDLSNHNLLSKYGNSVLSTAVANRIYCSIKIINEISNICLVMKICPSNTFIN